jgi:hypothetical protein
MTWHVPARFFARRDHLLVEHPILPASSGADSDRAQLPSPLTPAFCDLREIEAMPVDVRWLRDSDMVALASNEAFRAAMLLMLASWHQVPAGSVPDDDGQLSVLAGYGRLSRSFLRVKASALQGWVRCSDGRWYHPEVARHALLAWQKKQDDARKKVRRKTAAKTAADARWANSLQTLPRHPDDSGEQPLPVKNDDYQVDAENSRPDFRQIPHASGMRSPCVNHAQGMPSPSASSPEPKSEGGKAGPVFLETVSDSCVESASGAVPEFDLVSDDVVREEISPRRKKRSATTRKTSQDLRESLLSVDLPAWLPRDAWEHYVDFRFEIKSPLTLRARDLSIKKLSELKEEGSDPVAVIEQSILNGWKGLFAVKKQSANGVTKRWNPESGAAEFSDQKQERGAGSAVIRL